MNQKQFILLGEQENIFPLFTKLDMSIRWGVSKQVVDKWNTRDKDFCKPLDEIMAGFNQRSKVYPYHEVLRYEQRRGINLNG